MMDKDPLLKSEPQASMQSGKLGMFHHTLCDIQERLTTWEKSLEHLSEPEEKLTFDEMPEEAVVDALAVFLQKNTSSLLQKYDAHALGTFDVRKAEKHHLPNVCIPCFVGVPKDQRETIQLLYGSQNTDVEWGMPLMNVIQRAKQLVDEREGFLYELRYNFLKDLELGYRRYELYKSTQHAGPESYYSYLLTCEGDAAELRETYDEWVRLAKAGVCSDADEDYLTNLSLEHKDAWSALGRAYSQYLVMVELLKTG